jgi:hypothetical protein
MATVYLAHDLKHDRPVRLDPIWAPLKGNPRFERLVAGK